MEIRDISRNGKPFIVDRDENIFIGLDLPIHRSNGVEGYFASTTTTIEAVKNNIRNLLLTEKGERVMQPGIGLSLKRFLFEPVTDDLLLEVQNNIAENLSFWLPFVSIIKLIVDMDEDYDIGKSKMKIDITFAVNRNMDTQASLQVEIAGTPRGMMDTGDF